MKSKSNDKNCIQEQFALGGRDLMKIDEVDRCKSRDGEWCQTI